MFKIYFVYNYIIWYKQLFFIMPPKKNEKKDTEPDESTN